MQASIPQDVAFLGLINYYCKFVAQFSSILAPLYIAHKTNDGEKPIAFASISLSLAENNAHLYKEGLVIILFGVKKFHDHIIIWPEV